MPWDIRLSEQKRPRPKRSPAKSSFQKPIELEQAAERPKVAAHALRDKLSIRTSDLLQAREALAGATWAIVHADGGAAPNPGPGGFGVVMRAEGRAVDLFGGEVRTTNNRMELLAAISALEVLPSHCRTTIISDSKYVVLGASQWIVGWRRKAWKRDGKPLPNGDLWRRLDALMVGRSITWRWVKGHGQDRMNIRADELATYGRVHAN